MSYNVPQTNSNGGVAMFKVLVFMGAGFLACALVWSLNQNYQIQKEAAAAKTSYDSQIANLTKERDQAIQVAVDQQASVDQANAGRDQAQKELAAVKASNQQLGQQVAQLNQALAQAAQQPIIPQTGACPTTQAESQPSYLASGLIPAIGSPDFPVALIPLALGTWLLVFFGVTSLVIRRRGILMRVSAKEAAELCKRRLGR
jgi:hypothetical protein